jgi:phosphoserine phosphatase RsbU/P
LVRRLQAPDGQIGIVVGDIAGSGLRAAVVMGRLRSALRAYAIESAIPSDALARLDRKFAHFEPDEMATVLYITVASELDHFTVSSTRHLPPVIAVHGQDVTLLDCRPSPPIGAHVASRHIDVVCELGPGTTVGCYTDGLIERRVEPIDRGLERLRAAFYAGDVEDVCRSVMSDIESGERRQQSRQGQERAQRVAAADEDHRLTRVLDRRVASPAEGAHAARVDEHHTRHVDGQRALSGRSLFT